MSVKITIDGNYIEKKNISIRKYISNLFIDLFSSNGAIKPIIILEKYLFEKNVFKFAPKSINKLVFSNEIYEANWKNILKFVFANIEFIDQRRT